MSEKCVCTRCVDVLFNPDPCQCKDCIDAYENNVCPFQYGYNSAMRYALHTYQLMDPIWKDLDSHVDYSQDRMKAKDTEQAPP